MENKLFKQLLESTKEAVAIDKGDIKPSRVFKYSCEDVKELRKNLNYTQANFAKILGINRRTLENWEQGRREPTGAAKVLLKVIEKNPNAVINALQK